MRTRIVFVALLATACGGSSTASSSETVVPTQVSTLEIPDDKRVDAADVELRDPGAEPRAEVRLRPQLRLNETGSMQMTTTVAMRIGQMAAPEATSPPILVVLGSRVTDLAADGTFRVEYQVNDMSVEDDGSPMVGHLERELAALRQLRGWAIMDTRGRTLATDFAISSEASPQMLQVMESTRDALTQLMPALPEEAIGIGARWETISRVRGRINMELTSSFQLVDRNADQVTLEISVQGTAPPQPVEIPQPGASADLDSLQSTTRGNTVLRLGGIFPRSRTSTDLTSAMRVRQGDLEQHIETRMQMTTQIAPI